MTSAHARLPNSATQGYSNLLVKPEPVSAGEEAMTLHEELLSILEARLGETTGVYVNAGVDAEAYYSGLRSSIMESLCDPFLVTAKVMPPGFEGHDEGAALAGYCLAHKAGYWLVYRPEDAAFYCFWGATASTLGAHGVTGSPLYCWSA